MILPEPEPLLVAALKAAPSVAGLVSGRVGTRLSGTYPAVRVTLVGGSARPTTDTGLPRLQVECFGPGADSAAEGVASDVVQAVEAAVPGLGGVYGPGRLVAAWVDGHPWHSPDASTGRERYIVQVGVVCQPV